MVEDYIAIKRNIIESFEGYTFECGSKLKAMEKEQKWKDWWENLTPEENKSIVISTVCVLLLQSLITYNDGPLSTGYSDYVYIPIVCTVKLTGYFYKSKK